MKECRKRINPLGKASRDQNKEKMYQQWEEGKQTKQAKETGAAAAGRRMLGSEVELWEQYDFSGVVKADAEQGNNITELVSLKSITLLKTMVEMSVP
jgi:hypothetical protein